MIVGKTRTDVDKLWNAFWTGGITNPVSVIEQINYLLFIRRLDDIESRNERVTARTGNSISRSIFGKKQQHLRWSNFKQLKPDEMFKVVQEQVFPFIKDLGGTENGEVTTFSKTLADAVFLIQKSSLLSSAVDLISGLDLDNADTAGDLYEYLLSKLSTSGINGQFRTPKHIIRMMVEVAKPAIGEKICDPACGTAGFLQNALQYVLEQNTSKDLIQFDGDGQPYGFVGDKLSREQRNQFEQNMFFGFDFDATMLRVSSMNLWLHGIPEPKIQYADTLSKNFEQADEYDVILANPPFKGTLDYADCSPSLLSETKTKKTELLFVLLALRLLDVGGRAAIIVPDGVLFGNTKAHLCIRKSLIEENQLEGIISMPSGVFQPYTNVSTAVLIFSKGGRTDRVWFYDMEHDGYTLDVKREPDEENDIPDIVSCWNNRFDKKFARDREHRLSELRGLMEPLKRTVLEHQDRINKLQFECAVNYGNNELALELSAALGTASALSSEIHVLQREFNRLSRQFWVSKELIADNKFDLSASRYRQIERDSTYYPAPNVTLDRIKRLETMIASDITELEALIK